MGEIVLAAAIARRAKALGATTVVICDTHWVIDAGFRHGPDQCHLPGLKP